MLMLQIRDFRSYIIILILIPLVTQNTCTYVGLNLNLYKSNNAAYSAMIFTYKITHC